MRIGHAYPEPTAWENNYTPDVQAELDPLAVTREMLDRRYDEMASGKVQGIDGEEAYRRLMERTRKSE